MKNSTRFMLLAGIIIVILFLMGLLSVWAFIGLTIIILIIGGVWNANLNEKEKIKKRKNRQKTTKNNAQPKIYNEDKLLNYPKGVIRFEMKGMHYQSLTPDEAGDFIGTAECVPDEHDDYAVGIYNNSGYLLGFVPRNNKILFKSIDVWHNGSVFAWGLLDYESYDDSWYGQVYIPVGLESFKIEAIKYILKNTQQFKNINKRIKDKSVIIQDDEMFNILKAYKVLNNNANKIGHNYYLEIPNLPVGTLNSFSFKLQKEKQWADIVLLEKYSELILNEKKAVTFKKRIEKAKSELEK